MAAAGLPGSDPADRGAFAVSVTGLTKRFGPRTVIDGVDLSVPRGCAFGYLGPNGAGKTTLIRTILGLTRPSAGSVSILGHTMPEGRRAALDRVGAVVDEPRFHTYLSGLANLEILAAARGGHAAERIWPALERVGLAERATDKVAKYSMGMRQRLGIASCLLAEPELLILDEPMNGLDPAGMMEIRQLILGFVAEGRTVLLSSHLLDEVQRTCDYVAIVDQGKVVSQGRIADLVAAEGASVRVVCDDPVRAAALLDGLEGLSGSTVSAPPVPGAQGGLGSLTVRIGMDWQPELMAGAINRHLVGNGITVMGLWVERASLEQRFLQLTTRLGAS